MHAQFDYLNQIFIFSMLAVSLNLVMGYGGQPSIAHPAFAAVGGYGSALVAVHQGFGFIPAAAVGVAAGTIAGTLLALPAVKLSTDYIVLLTLAALYIMQSAISSITILGGDAGIGGIPQISFFNTPQRFLILTGALALATLVICWILGATPYGRALKAVREEEAAAQALGKNVFTLKATAFGITAGIAALAGVMLVYYTSFVASAQFSTELAIELFSMVIIGGSGNVLGSLFGTAVVIELVPFLQDAVQVKPIYAGIVQQIVYGALLVVFVLLRPQGILPERLGRVRLGSAASFSLRRLVPGSLRDLDQDLLVGAGRSSTSAHALATTGVTVPVCEPAMVVHTAEPVGHQGTPTPSQVPAGPRTPSPAPAPRWGDASDGSGRDQVAVEVRGLKKHYGGIKAVDGVDLDIADSTVTSLIGPNGAGKSTLFGLFSGFTIPDAGSVSLYGQEVVGLPSDRIARMGMVRSFQDVRTFLRLSCLDNVRVAVPGQTGEMPHRVFLSPRSVRQSSRRATEEALKWLNFVGLEQYANRAAGELAYAEQKLLAIARSLATGARVLLLDEPTSGIDPAALSSIAAVIDSLPSLGRTVCIVEHNLGFLERLHGECYFLSLGKVTARGSLHELMADEDLRKVYFGV